MTTNTDLQLSTSATRASGRVALVTCARFPQLADDDQPLLAHLRDLGVPATVASWDDPTVDWAAYQLVVLRSTWDYVPRRAEFVAWAATVSTLANPAHLVAWNTDKRYLADLAAAGVPVVATEWLAPGCDWTPPAAGEVVVKPTVGAGCVGAARFDLAVPAQRAAAGAHAAALGAAGAHAMVQPYLHGVDTAGETAVVCIDGRFSHGARKGPLLAAGQTGPADPWFYEHITPRVPSPQELAVADAAVAAATRDGVPPLYARVDLLPGPDGAPVVVELELTEPSLFLDTDPGAAGRFAAAIAARAAAGIDRAYR